MRLPFWLKGGILAASYVFVIFYIKSICAPEWCFADIFWPIVFQPMIFLAYLLPDPQLIFVERNLLISTIIVWFLLGSVFGIVFGLWRRNKLSKPRVDKTETDESLENG